jgi:IS5 family transposase
VLRETDPQARLWDALLPEEAKRLPAELARIDAFLDDERLIAPWRTLFDPRLGRPSVPLETPLRLLYLKHRYGLGYQSLCREVADSIGWRRFCRIPLDRPVPHPTTLVKLVGRAGPEVIGQLNQALLGKLVAGKLLRGRKLRGKACLAWEQTRAFKRMRNWRVGIEARISQLKRSFGLRRTRLRRLAGAAIWVGLGIFAYNLQRMTVIT